MITEGYYQVKTPIWVREDFQIVAVYVPPTTETGNAIMFGTSLDNQFPQAFNELGEDVVHQFHATYFDYPHRYSDDFAPEEVVTFDSIAKYSRGELFIESGLVELVSADHTNTIYPEAVYGCKFTGQGITKIEESSLIDVLESTRRTWGV